MRVGLKVWVTETQPGDNYVYRQKPHKKIYKMRKQRKYRERERERENFTTFIFYMLHASIATRKHKKDRVLQREERKNTPPKPGF